MADEKSLPDVTITHVSVASVPEVELKPVMRASPAMKEFQDSAMLLLGKHSRMDPVRKVAIAARLTGMALSLVDPAKLGTVRADAIIRTNIALGVTVGLKAAAKKASS